MNTKDKWTTTITIHDEVRAAIWGAIFPGARVPVRGIIPTKADLPGMPGAVVYYLDLDAVSDLQRDQLVRKMAELFSLTPDDVLEDMMESGVPILAADTILETDQETVRELIQGLGGSGVVLDPALFRTMMDGSGLGSPETCDCDRTVIHDCICPQCRARFLAADLAEIERLEAFELIEEADAAGLEEIDPSLAGVDPSTSRDLEIDDGGDDDDDH